VQAPVPVGQSLLSSLLVSAFPRDSKSSLACLRKAIFSLVYPPLLFSPLILFLFLSVQQAEPK
jgi:hypothetical protein